MGRIGQFKKGSIPWNKGKKLSKETKLKISKAANKQKRWYKHTDEAKAKIGKAINKHHKDLDHKNESDANLLYLVHSDHNSLHQKAYDYLVKLGKIEEYTEWFIKEYKSKLYTKKCYEKQLRLKAIAKEKRKKNREAI